MAMLAAPRRKQKVINLRAKNNAWSDDSTKFGQRMLEKMGWSEGKGLGAKENGMVEHVVARYKNDDRGLGFEEKNDQWTKHEDDFNSLLANLSNGVNNDEKLHSGVSLEVKSKKSKARVHYHKFTRGKDLTRYSDKDLANIFGKKSLKNEKPKFEEEQEAAENNVITNTEKVFTEKGSMEDYFKSKLAAIQSKNKLNLKSNDTSYNDSADFSFQGFSGATNDEKEEESHQGFGFQSFSGNNTEENDKSEENMVPECEEVSIEIKKKSKKKKKQKLVNEEQITQEMVDNPENVDTIDEPEKPKKSKKKKQKQDFEESVEEFVESKKSKKKKDVQTIEDNTTEDYVPKKKKKRKNKDITE